MTKARTSYLTSSIIIAVITGLLVIAIPFSSFAASKDKVTTTASKKMRTTSEILKEARANVDASCIQSAIGSREEQTLQAFIAYSESMVTALESRWTALYTAWGLSNAKERNLAITTAWKTWKTESKENHRKLDAARKSAWESFREETKNECKITVPKEEALEKDASGAISL